MEFSNKITTTKGTFVTVTPNLNDASLYIYLEPKWGYTLFWLEFRPCFGGLTFKNRGHLGSRYIYVCVNIYTLKKHATGQT